MKTNAPTLSSQAILDSINDGVYVTDTDRKIVYWSKSAVRITGWQPSDIVGKRCCDDMLCHVDKDGHYLCGEEYCPLYRAMVTDQASTVPLVVFAQGKQGNRIPMRVSVAPIHDASDTVIGGVETFRDLSTQINDIQRARNIQSLMLQKELPQDARIHFSAYYIPNDIIGGDYYAITRLDANHYGFLLADVTGHGVSAALYTMYLNSLWEDNRRLLINPCEFATAVNDSLCPLIKEEGSFAAGLCGVFDLEQGTLRLVGAGNPPPLLIRSDGEHERLDCSGLPLGLLESAPHDETQVKIHSGDCLLFYTDGAIEISDGKGQQLGVDGLLAILRQLGYPDSDVSFKKIEEKMLKYSDRIRFDDDLTFLEARLA